MGNVKLIKKGHTSNRIAEIFFGDAPKLGAYEGRPIPFEVDTFLTQLRGLMKAAYSNKEDDIRALVEKAVSTYHPEKAREGAEKDSVYAKLVVREDN